MAIKRHKPEEIVAKLRQVPTTSTGTNRPIGPKARHELTINMDQLVGADQALRMQSSLHTVPSKPKRLKRESQRWKRSNPNEST